MLHIMAQTSAAEPRIFSDQANEVLLEVRTALGQLLAARGVPPQTVQRAYRRLQIDKKLAWRLGKVLQSEDPYAAARHIPGAAAMRAVFDHAIAEGVPPPVIQRAREAIGRFDDFANAHARNRRAFDLMLSAHTASNPEETDVIHRKEAATALSYVWGVMADMQLLTAICKPGESGRLDVASITGFINLQWIRPNVGWIVKRTAWHDGEDRLMHCPAPEPLAPGIPEGETALLSKYCSPARPPMRRQTNRAGYVVDELVHDDVGTPSATTCLIGEVRRGWLSTYRDDRNDSTALVAHARTPCEMLLFDAFLHREMIAEIDPKLLLFGDLEVESEPISIDRRSRYRLMPWKKLEDVGWGIAGAYTPHFARYVDMLADCFNHLGWNPAEFQLFRAAIEYPVIPSTIAIRRDLPQKPA